MQKTGKKQKQQIKILNMVDINFNIILIFSLNANGLIHN